MRGISPFTALLVFTIACPSFAGLGQKAQQEVLPSPVLVPAGTSLPAHSPATVTALEPQKSPHRGPKSWQISLTTHETELSGQIDLRDIAKYNLKPLPASRVISLNVDWPLQSLGRGSATWGLSSQLSYSKQSIRHQLLSANDIDDAIIQQVMATIGPTLETPVFGWERLRWGVSLEAGAHAFFQSSSSARANYNSTHWVGLTESHLRLRALESVWFRLAMGSFHELSATEIHLSKNYVTFGLGLELDL